MVRSFGGGRPPSTGVRPPSGAGRDVRPPRKAIAYARFNRAIDRAASALVRRELESRCAPYRLDLVRVVEEINEQPEVTPLSQRTGLLEAIDAVRNKGASILVADAVHLGGQDSTVLLEIVRQLEDAGGHLLVDGRFIC